MLDQLSECCACDLAEILGVTQSAVSQHRSKFKAYGLVAPRRDGQTLHYRIASDKPEVTRFCRLAIEGIEGPAT